MFILQNSQSIQNDPHGLMPPFEPTLDAFIDIIF